MTRELSFGLSSPQAGTKQRNGAPPVGVKQANGASVQHVESLGAWAQNEAHRKPSIKLEGQSSAASTHFCLPSFCSLLVYVVYLFIYRCLKRHQKTPLYFVPLLSFSMLMFICEYLPRYWKNLLKHALSLCCRCFHSCFGDPPLSVVIT